MNSLTTYGIRPSTTAVSTRAVQKGATAHRVELADQPLLHRRVEPRFEHLHRDGFPAGRQPEEHHPLPALAEPPPQRELTQHARVIGLQGGDHGTEP
ncbi:hypothetical protein [Microbispora rosea]|uniref:hypothetical protein n=1 Tax=Microbispora rosea TaxID=58117 RepID=UPI00194F629D|nr:hypothetical protein [Microbispora rosea]GIH44856.1 hypothetical protein Mro03_00350 [Microbispora rosea subsp. rosea]